MGNILFVVVAAAGLVAAGVSFVGFSGRAKDAQRDLTTAREEHQRVVGQLTRVEAERNTLAAERDELTRSRDTLADERDRAWATVTEEEQRRIDAEARTEELRDQLGESEHLRSVADEHREADGCWALLLADIERRWAAVVGAPPEGRGVHLGAVGDQLGEALTRETDRLREEVGVDISLSAEASIEPADPVLFLLAATDLLNLLATGCQKVALTLDGRLVITGSEWSGTAEELEQARGRVLAAGATVDPLDITANVAEPAPDTSDPDASGASEERAETAFLPVTPQETYQVRVAVHPTA